MSNQNVPFKVLFPKNNAVIPVVDQTWDSLTVGQLAPINRDGKTITSALATSNREFALIVTRDKDGDTVADHIERTQWIQRANVKSYSVRCYTERQSHIVQLEDACCVECGEVYTLTLGLRSAKQMTWRGMSLNQKTFDAISECCEGAAGSAFGELLVQWKDKINADPDKLYLAEIVAVADIDTVGAAAMSDEDVLALDGTVEPCPAVLRVTLNPDLETYLCNEPIHAPEIAAFNMVVTGLTCCGTVRVLQHFAVEEGSWEAAKKTEMFAAGYNGNSFPYIGDGIPVNYDLQVNETKSYTVVSLVVENKSRAGDETFDNDYAVHIFIECGHNTLLDSIIAFLDAALTPFGLEALANDAALCDCNGVNPTSDLVPATDGIALTAPELKAESKKSKKD